MSKKKANTIELKVGDQVVYIPSGRRYAVDHVQEGPAGAPEHEATYWLWPIGRVDVPDRILISVPASRASMFLRKVSIRPTPGNPAGGSTTDPQEG